MLVGCQDAAYNTTYQVQNSTNQTLYVEFYEISNEDLFTRTIKAGDRRSLLSVGHGISLDAERVDRPPSWGLDNLVIRIDDENGDLVYMGVADEDWTQTLSDINITDDYWTLDISELNGDINE